MGERRTRAWFVVGLIVALLAVPAIALAATGPSQVQEGTVFNASAGPQVELGEDATVNLNNTFPAPDTVSLGATNTSGAEVNVTVSGVESGDAVSRLNASTVPAGNTVVFARDDATLSVASVGPVDLLGLESGAAVGDPDADLRVDTGGSEQTVEVRGLSGLSDVTFTTTSGQVVQTASVSSGVATATFNTSGTLTLRVVAGASTEPVSGFVVDSDGDPIANATVTTGTPGATFAVETASDGSYSLQVPEPADYSVTASTDAASSTQLVTVPSGGVTGLNFTVSRAAPSIPITGRVLDLAGSPIQGATVETGQDQALTNSSGFYRLNVRQNGTFQVTASTATDSKTQGVFVNGLGGVSGVDFALGGNGGATDPANPGDANLEIRSEVTGELLNNRTVTVRFFDENNESFATRNTTTGIVDLATVSEQPPLGVVAEAPNAFTRRILIDDKSARSTIFLLDQRELNGTTPIIQRFSVRDLTGQFSGPDTRFRIKKAMPKPGETGSIPLRVLSEDFLGGSDQLSVALEPDVRYRLQVENGEGDLRDLGPHFAVTEGPISIEIGRVEFNRPDGETFRVDASLTERTNTTETLRFAFVDAGRFTDSVALEIYERSNESNVLVDQTFEPETGDQFGAFLFSEVLSGNQTDKTWVVEYSAARNQTQDGLFTVSATGGNLGIPIDQGIQQILGVGMVIVLAGLFSTRNAAIGAIVVPLAAGTLWFLGFLTGATTGASIALALTLGVAYNFATGGV